MSERGSKRPTRDGNSKMHKAKKRVCGFCMDKVEGIDYKDTSKVKKYMSERGKIVPRRISGCCAKHQRQLTEAVKKARHIALLPYSTE